MTDGIVELTQADAPQIQALAETVGWSFSPAQARLLLTAGGRVFGLRADGDLVATAALYPYPPALASLGIVMVRPDMQRQGLGRRMVEHCLAWAEANGWPVMLVATEQGFPLYRKLGFETVATVHRLECVQTAPAFTSLLGGIRHAQPTDLPALIQLDAVANGSARPRLLEAMMAVSDLAFVAERRGHIRGFVLARTYAQRTSAGPVVAEDSEIAAALVTGVLRTAGSVRLDVPGHHTAFLHRLLAMGFREQRRSPLMLRPGMSLPGDRSRWFALADPALG
ncbi:MAG: GNAT family N-acetyltransferase [Thermoflavifilum sp.]|nr:GNAT family N-acetyltransferase [Thermoflavifilum sp.]MCL6513493.1 GNAT family N-acetyltransferase [Alicyclobacillus sp.]